MHNYISSVQRLRDTNNLILKQNYLLSKKISLYRAVFFKPSKTKFFKIKLNNN